MKIKKILLLISLIMVVAFVYGQNTATLTISISNIELNGSKIFVGLYDNKNDFKLKSGAVDSVILIPDSENIEVSLKNIPSGRYAVAVFQDINSNNKLDMREFKIPIEPIGISNYSVNNSFLLPIFNKAQFSVERDTLVFISLISRK